MTKKIIKQLIVFNYKLFNIFKFLTIFMMKLCTPASTQPATTRIFLNIPNRLRTA